MCAFAAPLLIDPLLPCSAVEANAWGHQSDGSIHNIKLRGVRFLGPARVASIIHGKTPSQAVAAQRGMITDVAFWNLTEAGHVITSAGTAFEIDADTTRDISFQ